MASRYARRKQRASTKIRATVSAAVKLATACAQGRPLVKFDNDSGKKSA